MVAGQDTVDKIYKVMKRNLNKVQLNCVIQELLTVPGNKSFRDTIQRLQDLHRQEIKRKSASEAD
jgi:hypothetical protein